MGLFFNYKEYEEILPIVLPNIVSSDYKRLSENQIIGAIGMYLENTQRILNDSVSLINTTENFEVYFKRFDMVTEILLNWSIISKYTMKYFKNGDPKNDYEKVLNSKVKNQKDAIDRYIDKEKIAIGLLATENGKCKRTKKMIEYLVLNIKKFTTENQKYINEIITSNS
ncbi:MAG TPA: hypothetical protein PKG96_11065 [Bacilli bacterium]|nr:hypothetical protein [Bacilli bacterium]